jgi:type III restriction enzyme
MKLKFKKQAYQADAVEAVLDCFEGQPLLKGLQYRIDPGRSKSGGQSRFLDSDDGFKNNEIVISSDQLLKNMHKVQRRQNLPLSKNLFVDKITGCALNLDIEMETGTGKTYCYIKTMFELYKHFGWSKFIIVVPSIAIREGVYKSLEITADHFLEEYHKRARFFIYNSKLPHELECYSSDAGINVMVINVQAFNVKGKDARRIYEELDDFQSRRPIDVIKSNRPILILDEPQKMVGPKTLESFKEFNPLMILRYSATHKIEHNKIYRLDALDAYSQKLVKKIAVRGISVKGLKGINSYIYFEGIEISARKSPVASVEFEVKQKSGIKRTLKKLKINDNLFELSGKLAEYKGFIVADINANTNSISFTNGIELQAGEVTGDVHELALRSIQIRETIKAHLEKERMLFNQGVKVLSLFFIDSVSKYRCYDDNGQLLGEYGQIFEEEYIKQSNTIMKENTPYSNYLKKISVSSTHDGYFSIDKKTKRLVDPTTKKTSTETEDVDAYDLILKDKERLLSLDEPVRFIFSHSALREGWDNPNVFVICTLKHSDNTISRRQEVGRGMRIAVNYMGERMDDPGSVHQLNVLTVIASESYKEFVTSLQRDIRDSLSERSRIADEEYFLNKILKTNTGDVIVTKKMAKIICSYLLKNDYIDNLNNITQAYIEAKDDEKLADLPNELDVHADQIFELIDSVHNESKMPKHEDDRRVKVNPKNSNFDKKEFQDLWSRINHKAAYMVQFDTNELLKKCVDTLNRDLKVSPLLFTIEHGEQTDDVNYDSIRHGDAFKIKKTETDAFNTSIYATVKYDLIGNLAEETQLTRGSVVRILQQIDPEIFSLFKINPEGFISNASQLINEQKATVIVEHLSYDPSSETYTLDIFTQEQSRQDISKAEGPLKRHIFDYVFTDSKVETEFVQELDINEEVVVYAKLPKGFTIPTPVGNYTPDWAISFKNGRVKHIYFIAETKGSMGSLQLRKIEASKIECARNFFKKITSDQVRYDVVDSFSTLMNLVK